MRGGWVTQLCTFAYVVVWPEILYEVEYEMEAEELGAADEAQSPQGPSTTLEEQSDGDVSPTNETKPREVTFSITTSDTAERARLERIALKAHREAADKASAHARKVLPIATAHPVINNAPHLAGLLPHIIHDAKKATGKESRYLSAIARRFTEPKQRAAWQGMCKYFDGRCALERIALQEDMKRKETWTLLTAMTEHLLCVRHW